MMCTSVCGSLRLFFWLCTFGVQRWLIATLDTRSTARYGLQYNIYVYSVTLERIFHDVRMPGRFLRKTLVVPETIER